MVGTEAAPLDVARPTNRRTPLVALGILAITALLYAGLGLPVGVLVLVALIGLAVIGPAGALIAVPASLALIDHPVHFGQLAFSPTEVILVTACLGVALRAARAFVAAPRAATGAFAARASRLALRGFGLVSLAFLAVGTFSLLTVADPAHRHESIRLYRWVVLEPVIFAFLARWYWTQPRDRTLAAIAYAGAAAVTAFYGLIALAFGAGLAVDGVVRISATYPHPNALALYLERPLVFAAALALAYRTRPRFGWLALTGVLGLGLLLTFSRGAWLGALAGTFLVTWFGQRRRIAAALTVGGVLALAGLALVAGPRLLSLFSGGSGSMRLAIWRSSIAMIRDHPVFGVGLDQFLYQYAPRYIEPAAWAERFTSHPHNLILDIWLSLGIMGLVVAAVYVVTCVRAARRFADRPSLLGLAAFGAIFAGTVHGLVDNGYFLPDLALAFWFLTALIDIEATSAGTTPATLDKR